MHGSRFSARLGVILSLLGSALVIYGLFFLPMLFGVRACNSYVMDLPLSQWQVMNAFFRTCGLLVAGQVAAVLLALPLLSLLFILGTSLASLFWDLSPAMVAWRRKAAWGALLSQCLLSLFLSEIYTFYLTPDFFPHLGVGFWLVLLGFLGILIGTTPRLAMLPPGH
jgi:hypothetical protein